MHSFFLKFNFIYLLLERGEGKEKERERNINVQLPLVCPLLGTWPATQACALTGSQTSNPLVRRPALNPLSYTSQGPCILIQSQNLFIIHHSPPQKETEVSGSIPSFPEPFSIYFYLKKRCHICKITAAHSIFNILYHLQVVSSHPFPSRHSRVGLSHQSQVNLLTLKSASYKSCGPAVECGSPSLSLSPFLQEQKELTEFYPSPGTRNF